MQYPWIDLIGGTEAALLSPLCGDHGLGNFACNELVGDRYCLVPREHGAIAVETR